MLVAARASSRSRYLQISWAVPPGTKMSKFFRQVRVRQIFGVLVMFKVRSDGKHLKERKIDFFCCLHSLPDQLSLESPKNHSSPTSKFEKRIRMLLIRMRMLPHTSLESPKNHSSLSTKFCTRAAVILTSELTRASTPTSKVSAGTHT